jgi:hypothetical protein
VRQAATEYLTRHLDAGEGELLAHLHSACRADLAAAQRDFPSTKLFADLVIPNCPMGMELVTATRSSFEATRRLHWWSALWPRIVIGMHAMW